MDYIKFDREKALKRFHSAQGYDKELALRAIVRFDAWQADEHRATLKPVDRIRRVIRKADGR